jgi:hypothetical protein
MGHPHVKAAPGLEGLEPFVGKWHTEGRQHEGPLGPASPFVAVETFEWLDGGHFLIHRLEGSFGKQPAACFEVFGKDEQGSLFAKTFYNDGNQNDWQLTLEQHALVLNGTWSKGSGPSYQVRYTAKVIEQGNALEGRWEESRDGQEWRTFLEARATKAQPLPNASVGG